MTSLLSKIALTAFSIITIQAYGLTTGEKAPAFSLFSHTGEKISLSKFKGKIVVLEWFNKGCPFVKKFYLSKSMQQWQKEYLGKGVVWLTISSSAKGKQGHESINEVAQTRKAWDINSTANLLDHDGSVGLSYNAKTTPHFFIVGPEQTILYQGAIDSIVSAEAEDIAKSKNYIKMALEEIMAGKEVSIKNTKAYGCSVKY